MTKRSHIGLGIKLQAALLQLGLDPKTAELDHDPALGLRPFSTVTGEYIPAENDPRYLVWRDPVGHRKKTSGTKATSAGSDVHLIAKSKRLVRKQAAHKAKLIAISGHMNEPALYRDLVRKGRIRPTMPWAIEAVKWERPKRRIPSRPFPNKKRGFANRNGN